MLLILDLTLLTDGDLTMLSGKAFQNINHTVGENITHTSRICVLASFIELPLVRSLQKKRCRPTPSKYFVREAHVPVPRAVFICEDEGRQNVITVRRKQHWICRTARYIFGHRSADVRLAASFIFALGVRLSTPDVIAALTGRR